MNCKFTITNHPLGKNLQKRFGTNVTKAELVWSNAIEADVPTSGFLEFVKAKRNLNEDFTLDTANSETIIDDMIDYYNKKHPDGNHSVLNNNDDASAPYGGSSNRFFAINRVADEINDMFREIRYENRDFTKRNREEWIDRAKARLMTRLAQRFDPELGLSYEAIKELSDDDLINAIISIQESLGDDITEQDKVLIATCNEMIVNSDEFFNLVFGNNKLQVLTKEFEADNTDDAQESNAAESNDVEAKGATSEEESVDNSVDISFRVFDSHSGQYGNFMTHIGGTLNSTLSSYHKCRSTAKVNDRYDFDTDNCIGIAECFTAQEIAQVLYTRNYNSLQDFIESVKQAAEQIPGYEGLIQLYDDLNTNLDFATECYLTFAKFVVGKKEVFRNDNGLQVRLSNNASSKVDSLTLEYYNNIRSTAISYNSNYVNALIKDIKEAHSNFVEDIKRKVETDDAEIRECIVKLAKAYSSFFPGINEVALLNYVNRNKIDGKVDKVKNIGHLYDRLTKCVSIANNIAIAYNRNLSSLAAKNRKNKNLRNLALANAEFIAKDKYEDTTDELNFDPLEADNVSLSEIINLAKDLSPYSSVRIDLNSRNAAGNLSSDVLNNSMISYLKTVLTSEMNNSKSADSPIMRFRDYKFRSKQYINSNILVEHKEEDGTIINYGLFRLEDGIYTPTEYFDKLIQFSLFNGVSDLNNGKNILYSDATLNDYFVTAFEAYSKSKDKVDIDNVHVSLGNFLMRTPSDAPKNYFFTMPKYSTKNLKVLATPEEHNRAVEHNIDSLRVLSVDEANKIIDTTPKALTEEEKIQDAFNFTKINKTKTIRVEPSTLVHILSGGKNNIPEVDSSNLNIISDTKAYAALESNGMIVYVLADIKPKGKKTILNNASFYGIKANSKDDKSVSWDGDIYNSLKTSIGNLLIRRGAESSKLAINRNSAIFKQMRRQFDQEMQDAGTAIHKLFRNAEGNIDFDENGDPIITQQNHNTIDRTQLLYENYHWNGKKLVDRSEQGKAKLTGKVFTSDKFTLFKDGQVINYMDEVLSNDIVDETTEDAGTINFLYGGASRLHINSNGEVYFTDEQNEAIDNAIEKFLIDYIDTTLERTKRFKDVIDEIDGYYEEDIVDFILNYRLAYYASNDLFEGNTKFYKNAQDFLKRAKEAQAGGIPYGLADYTKPYFGQEHIEVKVGVADAYLNTKEIQDKLSKLHDCKAYTTFKAVTIANSVRTDKDTIKRLKESLINQLTKDNMSTTQKKQVKQRVEDIMKGFEGIKTNDAQSYITFEEWIRRVAGRGQLAKYMPLIEKILDESKPLDTEDIKEFIQVQKNFYYDMQYDTDTDVMAPRQIKNAEFVLIPRLIKGTELEQVYNAMIEAGVDQLNTRETSKAGKSKTLSLWDNNSKLTQKSLNQFISQAKDVADIFDYNFLYTQQETPQHMGIDTENKFGLQISKKIIDNIPQFIEVDGKQVEHPLWQAKQNIQNSLCANIKDSWKTLLTDLGVKLDENDNIVFEEDNDGNLLIRGLNNTAILEKFKQELLRTGINSNLLDYVTPRGNDGTLDTLMPFYISSFSSKIENVAQSVFNRSITRQKLPGFHAAQITRIGFKKWKDSSEGGYVPTELRNRPVVDGKQTGYIEVMMPYSAFGFNPNDEKYKDMTPEERDKAMLQELEEKGSSTLEATLSKFIGYRIPTEAKMSSQVMKVVGFIPSEYGSTIVVPDDWVALTGSDFDIDSVYGIQYKTYKDKNSKLRKVQFIKDDVQLYANYVAKNLPKDKKQKFYDDIKIDEEEYQSLRDENGELNYNEFAGLISKIKKDLLQSNAEFYAESNGLLSFDEYSQKSLFERNSKDARNNYILDNMIYILEHPESLEETLSQSNFRHITGDDGAVQHVMGTSSPVARQRKGRSCYDFIDQAEGFEDASAGMALKGFSVSSDTFCSVCNTVRPTLKNGIDVTYNFSNLNKTDFANKVKELKQRFGEGNVKTENNNSVTVTHDKFGWSADNKNIDGFLITSYSAETTAHILDAIKEGAVPNVTINTFGVYKLFPNIGINYDTCVGFMMQPGVTKLVSKINATKSVYTTSYSQPIKDTLDELKNQVKKYLEPDKKNQVDSIIKNYLKTTNVLEFTALKKRFDGGEAKSLDDALFDYVVVAKYEELNNIATQITAYTMVCNPDKFGAKQTIFATNKIFTDIKRLLKQPSVFTGNFLESIYPGISVLNDPSVKNGIEAYIQNENNNSAYPSLHHYLKYATATSIKVNSSLFDTHTPAFEFTVNSIQNVFSGNNTPLTEETYNAFSKYILNYLYNSSAVISHPVTYDKKEGIMNVEGDDETERRRVYGFDRRSDISYQDKNGEWIEFNGDDATNPTDDEIANFAKLSPAQKVLWIQKTFSDSLICKYLKVQSYNSGKYSANIAGSQTIRFIEEGTDIENVYEEFRKTYVNSNPLLVLTAMDLVKYSVIVEGLRTKQNAVNKILSNKVLYNSGLEGCGFIDSIRNAVKETTSSINVDLINKLTHAYVKAHPDMKEISHTYISKKTLAESKIINENSFGVISVHVNDTTSDWLVEHKLGYNALEEIVVNDEEGSHTIERKVFRPNSYVQINYGSKVGKTLYRIDYNENGWLHLYPLNKLENNEFTQFSVNPVNNLYMDEGFYEALLSDYNEGDYNYEEMLAKVNEKVDTEESRAAEANLREQQKTSNVRITENRPFNINDEKFEPLRDAIRRHFDGTNEKWLYLVDNNVRDYILKSAEKEPNSDKINDNGQTIIVDGRQYRIWKPNTTRYSTESGKPYSVFLKYLINDEARKREISKADAPYTDLINWAREQELVQFTPFIVRPINSEVTSIRHSSITEEIKTSDKAIRKRAMNGDSAAQTYVRQVNKRDIHSTEDSVANNINDIALSTAEYVTNSVEEILNGENSLNYFVKDLETGELCSIASPQALNAIKTSPEMRRKFLRTLLEAQRLIDTYKSFATFKYDDSESDIKYYIDKVTESIRKLEDSNLLKQAEELYVNEYLTSITNNPNIKNNIHSLYDGFYMSSTINSWFNDLQEMGNPILQIITSDVMKDVRAKELQGAQRVKEFHSFIKDLKQRAAAAGASINWGNIVDDSGRWINDYNEQFLTDLETLNNNVNESYKAFKEIPNTEENTIARAEAFEKYLHDKLELAKWKLKNVHQPLTEDYYKSMIELEESMLNKTTNKFAEVYVEYSMLNDELKDILSHEHLGTLDSYWEERRKDVLQQIRNLRSNVIRTATGDYVVKTDFTEEPSSDPIIRRTQILNTESSAEKLDTFCKKRNTINNKYFDYNERFGFKEQLEKYQQIVQRYEQRDPISGRFIIPEPERNKSEEYVKAKQWIYTNTIHKYSFNKDASELSHSEAIDILLADYNGELFDEQIEKRTAAAINYFRNIVGARANKNSVYKHIAKAANVYDKYGVCDATKLTEDQIKAIKEEQELRYGVGEESAQAESRIMHSATTDDTIYTDAFWNGIKTNGLTNAEYTKVCTEVNKILRNVLDSSTGVLETSRLSKEDINAILVQFAKLGYNSITKEFDTRSGIKKKTGVDKTQSAAVKEFIENNVDFVLSAEDQVRFDNEKAKALAQGTSYYLAWSSLNYEYDSRKEEFVPNHLLWGHPKPKKAVEHKYINKTKTAAIRILNESFVESPTKYYYAKQEELIRNYGLNSDEYKAWYEANHIYNPHKKCMEPIVCWMTSEPTNKEGSYEPAFSMTDKVGKTEYQNKHFKAGLGNYANYKSKDVRAEIAKGYKERNTVPDSFAVEVKTDDIIPDGRYDSTHKPNPFEQELKTEVQSILKSLAYTEKAKKYIEKGYLPSKAIKQDNDSFSKKWLKELAKGFGYIETAYGNVPMERTVSYETDTTPDMPMLSQLTSEESVSRPRRSNFKTQAEFDQALANYEENKADIQKKNAEIHKALLDKDWESVISEFINKASHYNAIQSNKYNLYYAQKLLEKITNYHSSIGSLGQLSVSEVTDNGMVYDKKVDNNLISQYENWLHRLIYDEYKLPQGKKLKYAALAQSITSNMYMTLNLRGGIANVTVGESNILGEKFAREYFNNNDYMRGKAIYMQGLSSYATNAYSENSTTLADALIKGFAIVDYDEHRGTVSVVDATEKTQRLRDAMYCCQTMGEHFMQNSVMFSLMLSHKLVPNPKYQENSNNGEPKYILMNKEEYLSNADIEALRTVCTDEEFTKYKKFIEDNKSDANVNKEYALYRRNHVQEFIVRQLKDKAEAFVEARKKYRELHEKDFANYKDFYSQFELKDGSMAIKQNSQLEEMHNLSKDKEVSDAFTMMGKFKQRAISINKKIHGNYGKLDAAKIESQWWGGLAMQYHKHIVPGFMKRWRTKGYYNEERGTIEKGSYIALFDFFRAPIDQIAAERGLKSADAQALKGLQLLFSNITDYIHYLILNGHLLPEHEKANMRRIKGDIFGMLFGLTLATLARLGWDDDDDSFIYNMMLYEADRCYSENNMWNPLGAWNEAKTLYSTPIAAQSWIGDALNIMGNLAGFIIEGDEYEPNFATGRYAGRNKVLTYIERRTPYWRNIASLRDIADNNRYYKRTGTLVDWLPKTIAGQK